MHQGAKSGVGVGWSIRHRGTSPITKVFISSDPKMLKAFAFKNVAHIVSLPLVRVRPMHQLLGDLNDKQTIINHFHVREGFIVYRLLQSPLLYYLCKSANR